MNLKVLTKWKEIKSNLEKVFQNEGLALGY